MDELRINLPETTGLLRGLRFLRGTSQRTVVWLIAILFTVHNAEEAVAFVRMRGEVESILARPLAALDMRLFLPGLLQALVILSALAFILAAVVVFRPHATATLWLLLALEAAIAINAASHVATALVLFHGYGPGLITAVLVNAPFAVYVLRRAKREAWVTPRAWRMLAVGGLVLHGPVLIGLLWLVALRPGHS